MNDFETPQGESSPSETTRELRSKGPQGRTSESPASLVSELTEWAECWATAKAHNDGDRGWKSAAEEGLSMIRKARPTHETREGLCDCRDTTVDKFDGVYMCRQCKRPIRCAENTQKALKQHKPGCPKEAARTDGIDRWYTLDCDWGSQSEDALHQALNCTCRIASLIIDPLCPIHGSLGK